MNNKKIGFYIAYGVLTLVTLATSLYIQDEAFDHTTGPCLITSLTKKSNHQVKKLTEDGWNVATSVAPDRYVTDAIKNVTEDGKVFYTTPTGGVLEGSKAVMSNPYAGDTILKIEKNMCSIKNNTGYSYVKTINLGKMK